MKHFHYPIYRSNFTFQIFIKGTYKGTLLRVTFIGVCRVLCEMLMLLHCQAIQFE